MFCGVPSRSYSLFPRAPCCILGGKKCEKEASSCGERPQPVRLTVRHIEANGVGYNQGYTTLEGFVTPIEPWKDRWVPFLDLRGHLFNNGKPAANAGFGLRYLASSRVWGGNAYWDYRDTVHQHYNQVSLGFESLGEIWDFRLNGYLPVGDKRSPHFKRRFNRCTGQFSHSSRKFEFSMKGVNAEVGAHVNNIKDVPFYFAAGPYYLEGQGKVAWGGELRATVDLLGHLRLEANTSYDTVFHWIGQGQIGLVFPLGDTKKLKQRKDHSCSQEMALAERTIQRVDRFEIIPVKNKH